MACRQGNETPIFLFELTTKLGITAGYSYGGSKFPLAQQRPVHANSLYGNQGLIFLSCLKSPNPKVGKRKPARHKEA